MSWIERGGIRIVLDESPLTAAAVGAPEGRPLGSGAPTVALRAAGRHLDLQVLAGATTEQLDGTLAVMRGIHLQAVSALAAATARTAVRSRVSTRRAQPASIRSVA